MRRKLTSVVTIHGIRTPGDWQTNEDGMGRLLSAHFEHRPFTYDEYRHPILGVVWLALAPISLALSSALCISCFGLILIAGWHLSLLMIPLIAAFAIYGMAAYLARKRLNGVICRLKKRIGAGHPHIIAHSLGSFLLGSVLKRFSDIKVGRIIFAGSVLPSNFAWVGIRSRFTDIRNEMATDDWVPDVAEWLSRFIRDLGCSGAQGFQGAYLRDACPPYDSLQLPDAKPCSVSCGCFAGNSGECVQNVHFHSMRHTDWFEGTTHALRFWLPHLWAISAQRYAEFVQLCFECQRTTATGDRTSRVAMDAENHLRDFCWGWVAKQSESAAQAARRNLKPYLRDRGLKISAQELDELEALTIHQLWNVIARAHRSPESCARDLHPDVAMEKAAKTAFQLAYPRTYAQGA